jgi:hypothetical protein
MRLLHHRTRRRAAAGYGFARSPSQQPKRTRFARRQRPSASEIRLVDAIHRWYSPNLDKLDSYCPQGRTGRVVVWMTPASCDCPDG